VTVLSEQNWLFGPSALTGHLFEQHRAVQRFAPVRRAAGREHRRAGGVMLQKQIVAAGKARLEMGSRLEARLQLQYSDLLPVARGAFGQRSRAWASWLCWHRR